MEIIFATGHRKSGTSVFLKLFEGHREINSFPIDVSLFYGYFPCFVANHSSHDALKSRLRVVLERITAPMEGKVPVGARSPFVFKAFWTAFERHIENGPLDRRSVMLEYLLRSFAEATDLDPDKPWIVKETSQAIFARELMEDLPHLRMLNLVRDPRDNYAALKVGVSGYYEKLGEDEKKTLASLINRARMDFLASRVQEKQYPERFLSIRFEDVALCTEETMRNVAQFCGLSFNRSLLTPTFLGQDYSGNSHEGVVFKGVSAENISRWRERISENEAMIIEFWLQDVMQDFGYPPAFDPKDSAAAFAEFYEWYNCHYFFHDPFARTN
jgi:hypothetical protein